LVNTLGRENPSRDAGDRDSDEQGVDHFPVGSRFVVHKRCPWLAVTSREEQPRVPRWLSWKEPPFAPRYCNCLRPVPGRRLSTRRGTRSTSFARPAAAPPPSR